MPHPHGVYFVLAWKAPVGGGASDTYHVELDGYGKLNSVGGPHCVANEWLAHQLAQLARLPVPPGALIDASASPSGAGVGWVTLSFTRSGIRPGPVDPAAIVAAAPEVAARLIVFDLLIANFDRHVGNLTFRRTSQRIEVFDHSHALLGIGASAVDHIRLIRDQFVLDGVTSAVSPTHNRHCLIDHIGSPDLLRDAADYIRQHIRESTLREVCNDAADLNLITRVEADELFICLRHRWTHLRDLLYNNRGQFTATTPTAWGLPI
jgi:hypothetical protein